MLTIYIVIFLIALFIFIKNIFTLFSTMNETKLYQQRLKSLNFERKEDADLKGIIDTATKPIISYILPHISIKKPEQIEKDLKMSRWDKYMNVKQYIALKYALKLLGIIAFLIIYPQSSFMAVIWFVVLFFGLNFLMRNSANNRRQKLMNEFPDLIRISQGYISIGYPIAKAFEYSMKFVGEEWQEVLRDFVVTDNLSGIDKALDKLKEDVDVFEVREFISLIKFILEQGGDAKSGFESQANKIQSMLEDVLLLKIGKRKTMSIIIQAPLLLAIMAAFGLPTLQSMMNLGM